jgi:hypothetical protein
LQTEPQCHPIPWGPIVAGARVWWGCGPPCAYFKGKSCHQEDTAELIIPPSPLTVFFLWSLPQSFYHLECLLGSQGAKYQEFLHSCCTSQLLNLCGPIVSPLSLSFFICKMVYVLHHGASHTNIFECLLCTGSALSPHQTIIYV